MSLTCLRLFEQSLRISKSHCKPCMYNQHVSLDRNASFPLKLQYLCMLPSRHETQMQFLHCADTSGCASKLLEAIKYDSKDCSLPDLGRGPLSRSLLWQALPQKILPSSPRPASMSYSLSQIISMLCLLVRT